MTRIGNYLRQIMLNKSHPDAAICAGDEYIHKSSIG